MSETTVADLMTVLDEERDALRRGAFDQLDPLLARKEALFAALNADSTPRSKLRRLKARLDENQTLLQAAIAGVGAARERMAALSDVRAGLSVYNQAGGRDKVPTARPGLEKKA